MRKIIILYVLLFVIIFSGCAENNVVINKIEKKDNLKELISRVKEYWKLRKEVRSKECYKYEVRNLMGVEYDDLYKVFVEKWSGPNIRKVYIVDVAKERKWNDYEEICLKLKYVLKKKSKLGIKEFYKSDCWVLIEKKWYHLLNNKIFFKY